MKRIIYNTLLLFAITGLSSCEDIWRSCIDGNGIRVSEDRDVDEFERIQVNGDFDVQIDTSDEYAIRILADENLMNAIVTQVSGDRLIIETRNGVCLRSSRPIQISVTTPVLRSLRLNGSGYIYCSGLVADDMEVLLDGSGQVDCRNLSGLSVRLELAGSGEITTNLVTEDLVAKIEGSGEIRVSGETLASDLEVIGSGNIDAADLQSNACVAYISGSGIIDALVYNSLDATIIGSGTIYYAGEPAVTKYISGSGRVVKR